MGSGKISSSNQLKCSDRMCSLTAVSSSLLLLILSPSFSLAAIGISTGSCPPVRGMSDFDVSAYLGQWYEYSNMFEIYQDVFAVGAKCVRATYTEEGNTVGVKNEYVSPLTGYGSIDGSARFANSSTVGELIVNFNNPESLWLLTRDALPSDATVDTALGVMQTNHLPWENLVKTSQTGCKALPQNSL